MIEDVNFDQNRPGSSMNLFSGNLSKVFAIATVFLFFFTLQD